MKTAKKQKKNPAQQDEELIELNELLSHFKYKKYTAYIEHHYLVSIQIRFPTKFFLLFSKNFSAEKHGVTNMLYQFKTPGMCKLYVDKVLLTPFVKRVRALVKHLKEREAIDETVT